MIGKAFKSNFRGNKLFTPVTYIEGVHELPESGAARVQTLLHMRFNTSKKAKSQAKDDQKGFLPTGPAKKVIDTCVSSAA